MKKKTHNWPAEDNELSNFPELSHIPQKLSQVYCPQCNKPFRLIWNDYREPKQTLMLRGCPSGGIYDISIHCPYCDYEEEL